MAFVCMSGVFYIILLSFVAEIDIDMGRMRKYRIIIYPLQKTFCIV